ncbi:MAG: CHAD domain-containing protein [Chloroflexi bacterium]|nr:MAG: CHAD domain-containing protein [Chloroflexota bacterium]
MSAPGAPEPAQLALEELGPDATAGDAVRRAITASTLRLLGHEAGVRTRREPEDVHQARVATRRLRSDLRTFAPLLDREWLDGLRAELKWLGGELGPVRDAEVLRDRLVESARSLLEIDRESALAVVAPLAADVRVARRRLLAAMRTRRYRDLLDRLVEAARAPALLGTASTPAVRSIPRLARRPWRRLRSAAAAADERSPDEQLHDLRIRAKRSRYAAEAAAAVAGKQATIFARAVAALQDTLGELHDAVVAEAWLRRQAAGLDGGGQRFAAGELVALQRNAALEARGEWPAVWDRARAKDMRSWM